MEVKKITQSRPGRQKVYMVARWLRGSISFHVRGVRMDQRDVKIDTSQAVADLVFVRGNTFLLPKLLNNKGSTTT